MAKSNTTALGRTGRAGLVAGGLAAALAVGAGCGKSDEAKPAAGTGAGAGAAAATVPATAAAATPAAAADPKAEIALQFELIKAGNVDQLKLGFTPRVRDRVTQRKVDEAKEAFAWLKVTIDDLVASVAMGEADGKPTAKITSKERGTLTTLIKTDGRWLADTLWFD
jgi:pyruvate/2-oxoglutarate dehydrogenase complex dihydrolipoamide acyltransferase (E2) component